MKQLGAQDSQFLYMENGQNLSNVTMVNIYAKSQRQGDQSLYEVVKQHVQSRLHTSPIFKRKLVRVPLDLDFPYWADDEYFDLDAHLHLHRLPVPGDWAQFSDLVGRVQSRPLDMNRPVWEMHIVENLGAIAGIPADGFALLTKMHHAAVDGAAMVKFFAGLSDADEAGTPLIDITMPEETAGATPSSDEMWKRCLLNNIRSPLKLTKTLLRATPSFMPAALKALTNSDAGQKKNKVPHTLLNKKISPWKTFDALELKLADFKFIQKAVENSKINDVVLAVCSGAMRKYLIHHNALPDSSLVAWVPINSRQKNRSDADEGNNITAMTTDLHTDLADPIERLQQITRQTQLSKAAKSGVSARLMTDVSQHMPGATMALASRLIASSGMMAKLCNIAISNVPGIQAPVYLAGAKCLQQFGMTPLGEGLGLFFVALSYNGKLTLTITTTRDIVADTDVLRQCLGEELAELKRAAKKRLGTSGKIAKLQGSVR